MIKQLIKYFVSSCDWFINNKLSTAYILKQNQIILNSKNYEIQKAAIIHNIFENESSFHVK